MAREFSIADLAGSEKWLSQRQIARLLGVKTSIIADLVRYLYKTGELDPGITSRKQKIVQSEGRRQVSREVNCYNRALLLAVAWRVHSDGGERFRQWAYQVLNQQLSQGYSLNREQLALSPQVVAELRQAVADLPVEAPAASRREAVDSDDELSLLLMVFRTGLQKLFEFEYNKVGLRNTSMLAARPLEYFEVSRALDWLRETLFAPGEANSFALEKPGQLESLLVLVTGPGSPGKSYPSIEQKAVYLLWLVIHRRPFEDGNLQLGAFLFVWFLQRNGLLYRDDGSLRLRDNALVAMVLLAARSAEDECDLLVSLLAGLINREN